MTKKHFARSSRKRNKLRLRNVPDELHIHGSLERRENEPHAKTHTPKMVLSEAKNGLSTAFGA